MEIEIRAKIQSGKIIENKIKKIPDFKFSGNILQDDQYFKHKMDKNRKLVIRIRKTAKKNILTFKAKANGKDTAWSDLDIVIKEPEKLKTILLHTGYEKVVRIKKNRKSYNYKKMEVNIDHIVNLGYFIEIEGRGSKNQRKLIEKKILKIFENLQINKKDIIYEGYVPLALKKKK